MLVVAKESRDVPAKIIQIIYAESTFYIQIYIVVCRVPGEHFHKETCFM